MNRSDELTLAWLNGDSSSAGEQELAQLLEKQPDAARDHALLLELEADLREAYLRDETIRAETREKVMARIYLLAEARTTENVFNTIRREQREADKGWGYGRWLALAASVAVLIGGTILMLDLRKEVPGIATLRSATASVTVTHNGKIIAAREGMEIYAGDLVQLARHGESLFEYRGETTTLVLREGGRMRIDLLDGAKRVNLQQGVLACAVAKQMQGKPMRFITPHAQAVVLGTKLTLAVSDVATRLEVTEGRVQLAKNDQAVVMVDAGEYAVAAEGLELRAQPLTPALLPQANVVSSTVVATNHFALRPDGSSSDPNFFPIGVWLQEPVNASAYKDAGINVYVDLWQGPTEEDLVVLADAGMKTICSQNRAGLKHINDGTIIGWMSYLEPDDAEADGKGGFNPPMDPSNVIQRYDELRSADATRPVFLNLGMGAAWKDYPRLRTHEDYLDDYRQYVKGGDIMSFHIYPVNNTETAIYGNLWFIPLGVDNLRTFSGNAKPVWCLIECTKLLADSPAKPTPAQVRSEVWMALIHGANGFAYFCHSWAPGSEDDAALLHDPVMLAVVADINRQISSLAPVLNSPTLTNSVVVSSGNAAVPVDVMVKNHGGATYIFAAAMRDGAATATFTTPSGANVEVLGENRSLAISDGKFNDHFESYRVHLYKLQN